MSPTVALVVWLVLVMLLLRFDPAKNSDSSLALWVPVLWMFIIESRLPSQWFGMQVGTAARAFEEGNPLDRLIYFLLIALSLGILLARSFRWSNFFVRNIFLTAFICYSLVSVIWSDVPLVAFKRWFRDLGSYGAILVVLSDVRPIEAVHTFLRRLYYLLIPLSIVLVKYYPQIGRQYNVWTGSPEYIGAATSKNTLGFLCLLSGVFFFWDTITRWSDRKQRRTKRIIWVNLFMVAMTVWLLNMSNSATSRVCLLLGCGVILAAHGKWGIRHPRWLKGMIPIGFFAYLILAFVFDLNGILASQIGRDPSMTGRTTIWQAVLSTNTNPIIGTGYESFWLGHRLNRVWQLAGSVTEAHNGYLETYLNLGGVGLFLLAGLLISSYRSIDKNLESDSNLASLNLALLAIALFYNITEAAFAPPVMCLTFLLGTVAIHRTVTVNRDSKRNLWHQGFEPGKRQTSSRGVALELAAPKSAYFNQGN